MENFHGLFFIRLRFPGARRPIKSKPDKRERETERERARVRGNRKRMKAVKKKINKNKKFPYYLMRQHAHLSSEHLPLLEFEGHEKKRQQRSEALHN